MKHIKIDGVVYHYNEKTEEYISSDRHVAPHSFIVKSFAEGKVENVENVKLFVFDGGRLKYAIRNGCVLLRQSDYYFVKSRISELELLERLSTEDFTVEEIYL